MQDINTMTAAALCKEAFKTGQTISYYSHEVQACVLRYNQLKARMVEIGIWDSFCDTNKFDRTHDSSDCQVLTTKGIE